MSPPAWAYQVDAFDPPPDEELVCSICHSVFNDPVQSPCHHVFCRNCINKWLESNRNCPICRKRTIRYSIQEVVPLIRNMIMKLTLRCHNLERGCETKVTLEGCEGHAKECMYEMIQCRNKPCKQMILRKDINDHELHDCSHRFVRCKKCGVKVSLIVPEKHDCVKALRLCLKGKLVVIKKKKEKIKELQKEIKTVKKEIKTLKENEHRNSETSSMDSVGEEDMINLRDMSGLSSGSSISSTSFVSELDYDETYWRQTTSDILEGLERRYRNTPEELLVEEDSIEYPRSSSPMEGRSSGAPPPGTSSATSANASKEDTSMRRPPKRTLTAAYLENSTDEDEESESSSVPSPKRQWMEFIMGGRDTITSSTANGPSTSGGAMWDVSGPSSRPSTSAGAMSTVSESLFSTRTEPTPSTARDEFDGVVEAPPFAPSYQNGGGTFQRTMALLSQYNLESDPEWVPGHSDPLEDNSDCSLESPLHARDGYITSSDESSLSDSDSDSSFEPTGPRIETLGNIYSSSDDDPDFQPNYKLHKL